MIGSPWRYLGAVGVVVNVDAVGDAPEPWQLPYTSTCSGALMLSVSIRSCLGS